MDVNKINTATALLNSIVKKPVAIEAFGGEMLCRHWKASERLVFVKKINAKREAEIDGIKAQAEIVFASLVDEKGQPVINKPEDIEQVFETDPDGVAMAFLKVCEINDLHFETEKLEDAEKN